jgi:hypothetical protein
MSVIKKDFVSVESLTGEEKKRLRGVVLELNDSLTRIAAEQELQKETIGEICEKLNLDKKIVRKMARTYFKSNYNEEIEANQSFEEFYSKIVQQTAN